uniref:hypothetical protein n=1 Tax=Bacillus altitudinis TaxID=293387 RepID=UPI00307E32A5
MMVDVVAVIGGELGRMVEVDGGGFGSCELKEVYGGVINGKNGVKGLLDVGGGSMIVEKEKGMVEEGVDGLIDNGGRGGGVRGGGNRGLKCVCEMVKGKEGGLGENLIGKG